MNKIQQINENFSMTPGSECAITNDEGTECRCDKGTLYVLASGAKGTAESASSHVFALVDGAIAEQKHSGALVQAMVDGAKAIMLPRPKPAETGSSRTAGSDKNDMRAITGGRNPY